MGTQSVAVLKQKTCYAAARRDGKETVAGGPRDPCAGPRDLRGRTAGPAPPAKEPPPRTETPNEFIRRVRAPGRGTLCKAGQSRWNCRQVPGRGNDESGVRARLYVLGPSGECHPSRGSVWCRAGLFGDPPVNLNTERWILNADAIISHLEA